MMIMPYKHFLKQMCENLGATREDIQLYERMYQRFMTLNGMLETTFAHYTINQKRVWVTKQLLNDENINDDTEVLYSAIEIALSVLNLKPQI